jgi:hypothetical protein
VGFREKFNKFTLSHCLPEKPVILACTLNVDDNSGDNHGYTGIAKTVALKLGGEFRHINDDMLHAEYPRKNSLEAMTLYYRDHGVPDIILSLNSPHYFPQQIGKAANDKIAPLIIKGINESLYRDQMQDRLVAHHITPDALNAAGKAFVRTHRNLSDTLIAVMMADSTTALLACNLVPRLNNIPSASIFVCSGRRTKTTAFSRMMHSFESEIKKYGRADSIKLHGYDYERELNGNSLNPYLGLLDRSDHIVVCGDSRSIVSEALSTQRSVHLYSNNPLTMSEYDPQLRYKTLIERGFIDCSLCDHFKGATQEHDRPLNTRHITLQNPTEIVADHVIRDYAEHYRKNVGYFKGLSMRLMG